MLPKGVSTAIRATAQKIETALSELYDAVGANTSPRQRADSGKIGFVVGHIAGYLFALNLLNRGLANLQQKGLLSPTTRAGIYGASVALPIAASFVAP